MNLLEQIARHLAFCGLGRAGESVFWGRMPDTPDECLCVFPMGGTADGARVRVISRAAAPGTAYETACRLTAALDGFQGFLGGDGAMAQIDVTALAAAMGEDERKRACCECELTVRACESGR